MDEEQYAALLAKITELEARIEALSHHGMDHGAGDAMDNGVLLREIKIAPLAIRNSATLYLQEVSGSSQLMAQYPTGVPVSITAGNVTNGNSHDHAGGDGAQIDHGGLAGLSDDDHPQYRLESADHSHQSTGLQGGKLDHGLALDGLSDDDHTQYIKHSLATALSDFLVASGAGAFVKKTLPEVKTILGLGTAAYTASTDYEPAIANGTANYLRGMNAAANGKEWKSLAGTANQVVVTHAANLITLSAPQNLHTAAAPTFAGVIGAYLKPASDSTTALQLQQSGGTSVLNVDTTNSRIGIRTAAPRATLDISDGTVNTSGEGVYGCVIAYATKLWSSAEGIVAIQSNDAMAINKGGSIAFGGRPTTGSDAAANWAAIGGFKENGTTNNYGGYLTLSTRKNDGTPITGQSISSTGIIRMPAYGAGTATFDASGNISSVSDIRFKDVMGSFNAGLPEIMKLQPIRYRWNKQSGLETEHEYAGFSAQDVEAVIPIAVGRNSEGHLSLQDRALMAAMVNAIKELKREIDQMKKGKK